MHGNVQLLKKQYKIKLSSKEKISLLCAIFEQKIKKLKKHCYKLYKNKLTGYFYVHIDNKFI